MSDNRQFLKLWRESSRELWRAVIPVEEPPQLPADFSDWILDGALPPEVQIFQTPAGPLLAVCEHCKRPWMRNFSECPGCGGVTMEKQPL